MYWLVARYQDAKLSCLVGKRKPWNCPLSFCVSVSGTPPLFLKFCSVRMASGCHQEERTRALGFPCLTVARTGGLRWGSRGSTIWSWAVVILLPVRALLSPRSIFTYSEAFRLWRRSAAGKPPTVCILRLINHNVFYIFSLQFVLIHGKICK